MALGDENGAAVDHLSADLMELVCAMPDACSVSRAVRDSVGAAIDMRLMLLNDAALADCPDPTVVVGRLCSQLWPDMVADGSLGACMIALNSGVPQTGEIRWVDGDTFRPASYSYRAVPLAGDLLLWILGDATDSVKRAQSLAALAARLAGARSRQDVAEAYVDVVVSALGAATGAVSLESPLSKGSFFASEKGFDEADAFTFTLSDPLPMAEVIREGRSLFMCRLDLDRRYPTVANLLDPTVRSSAVLPLMVGDRRFGALSVHFAANESFDQSQQLFLEAAAGLVAQAIARTTATERADRATAQLHMLLQLSDSLAAALDVQQTVDALAGALVPDIADGCLIYLLDRDGEPRLAALAHHDPGVTEQISEMMRRFPPNRSADVGVGNVVTAAYWPSVQPGPEGFNLPQPHQMFIRGVNLQREYVLAEAALNAALRKALSVQADSPLPPEALHRAWYVADVAELAQRRAEAKLAYDAHRVAGFW